MRIILFPWFSSALGVEEEEVEEAEDLRCRQSFALAYVVL